MALLLEAWAEVRARALALPAAAAGERSRAALALARQVGRGAGPEELVRWHDQREEVGREATRLREALEASAGLLRLRLEEIGHGAPGVVVAAVERVLERLQPEGSGAPGGALRAELERLPRGHGPGPRPPRKAKG